ncbi:MAG TPA: flagellar biosynthetic protein FliO [candidate division Zixibacteria bacterium]|nr:flagellar biosynthetic protein FliO [candidate division Zixibacteria bacterium]MDD4916818.1 flagellar biosynthetic protein FliO [candidate division Zixibacteria bacterium]MDM7972221.1 flagellar biosynthetic protein FliO [candidate division Zixibacteria bacterium]HOD65180.1 flagellar biosynthetic protein FliO [candidate division Zixibacteria bacterium]HOZ06714.1 flagellar biosynthetic protein FliO [candidate division Zixibacteria bacterium]
MNSKLTRRRSIGLALILGAAIAGLALINGGPASAERGVDLGRLQAAPNSETDAAPFAGSALPSLVRIASALAIVIACIYGGIYALRRLAGKRGGFGRSGRLEIIETAAVAPRKTISLVRVADKAVLVGVTETAITLLTELSPEKTAEILAAPAAGGEAETFPNVLKAASGKLRTLRLKRKDTVLTA